MKKFYRVAGIPFQMDASGMTAERAEKYRIQEQEAPLMEVTSAWEQYRDRHPNLTDDEGHYLSTGNSFYRQLLYYDGLMLHSSAVVVDDVAYLFTADSGTGKSTHTSLWLKQFGARAYILNDDKPALRCEEGVWYAYGTPWSGKNDISEDRRVPLGGIALLKRGETNVIKPAKGIDAIHKMFKQVNHPKGKEYREKLLELLDRLLTDVPVWDLQCNMEPEAATVAYEAMSKGVKQ